MKKATAALAALALALGGVAIGASAASAHTPSISADCSGVTLKATAYEGKKKNRWSVTVGDKTESGTFGASFNLTVPVPQDGATTTWSATLEAHDGKYAQKRSGTVGPCGEVPTVIVPQIQDYITCDGAMFVLDNTGSNREVVYTLNGVEHVVPTGAAPHVPVDRSSEYVVTAAGRTWTFAGLVPQSADPEAPCFDRPEEPVAPSPTRTVQLVSSGVAECGDTTVTDTFEITETTHGWVWNEETKSYDPASSSSVRTETVTRDLEQHELDDLAEACFPPVTPPVEPPVTPEEPSTPPVTPEEPTVPTTPEAPSEPVTPVQSVERPVTFASTGTTATLPLAALALLLAGGVALAVRRVRNTDESGSDS